MTQREFSKSVHDALWSLGITQRQWAINNGFDPQYTSIVVQGRSRALRGKGREIRLQLEKLISSQGAAA